MKEQCVLVFKLTIYNLQLNLYDFLSHRAPHGPTAGEWEIMLLSENNAHSI